MRQCRPIFVVPFGLFLVVGMALLATACTPADDDDGGGVTCVVEDGQCPNFCGNGLGVVGEGLGIGLALVKQLVELHGGEIVLQKSLPGEGSTFEVRLPLAN